MTKSLGWQLLDMERERQITIDEIERAARGLGLSADNAAAAFENLSEATNQFAEHWQRMEARARLHKLAGIDLRASGDER